MSKKKTRNKSGRESDILTFLKKRGPLVVFLFAFLLYANTLGHGYTQDDAIVITENVLTKQGVQGIPDILTKDTFFGFFQQEGKSRLVAGGRYRPLTLMMFAVEYELFGMKPWIGHLMNVLLFGLTAMLVYLLLMRIASPGLKKQAWLFALIGAALFAAHPVHTEAVANIKGRDEIMALLLSLTAFYILFKPKERIGPAPFALSFLAFFAALLSKENSITFLAVVPLAVYLFKGRKVRPALMSVVPLILATGVFLWIRGLVIGWELGDAPRELLNNPFIKVEGNRYVDFTFGEKSATIMYTLGNYIRLLFFPHPLTHDYYPRHIDIMHWGDWKVLLSLAAYLGLIVAAIKGWKKQPLLTYGILFFLITLSIVSNVVFPVGTNMSERFIYMPSLGWAIAVGWMLMKMYPASKRNMYVLVGLILLGFAIKTVVRNTVWKSNYTLFMSDVETSDNSAKLLAACAGELITRAAKMEEGPLKDKQIRDGLDYLDRAQEIHPNYKMSYLLEGNGNYYLEQWEAAIRSYEQVLSFDPANSEGLKNLGITLRDAGRYYGQQAGDLQKSVEYLERAYQLIPTDYETVHSLGVAYGMSGQPGPAVTMLSKGVELQPENAMAHFNLGLAYQRSGDPVSAQKHREIALELDPEILKGRSQ